MQSDRGRPDGPRRPDRSGDRPRPGTGATASDPAEAPARALSSDEKTPPRRVVSLNLCTDLLAMLIAAPGQLAAVSVVAADRDYSAMAQEALAYPRIFGSAEEVFPLQPDLVLAGAYTTPVTVQMLERLGFEVRRFPIASSLKDVRANILAMGEALGRPARARALAEAFDARIAAAAPATPDRPRAALHYANSWSSGAGTLADDLLRAAGLANVGAELGLTGGGRLPLEALVMARPDLIIRDKPVAVPVRAQEVLTHPALRPFSAAGGRSLRADQDWICGTPFTARAVAKLAEARAALDPAR